MRVLMITSEWPTSSSPTDVPFVVQHVESLRKAHVDVVVFHFRGRGQASLYFQAWKAVREQLHHENYDLIHAQWGQSGLLALPKEVPLVVTFRGSDVEGIVNHKKRYTLKGKLLKTISYVVAKCSDEAIVVSPHL